MKTLMIIGGGGHTISCMDVIKSTGLYNVIGIIDTPEQVGSNVLGVPVIGTDQDILSLANKTDLFFIGIGQIGTNKRRNELFHFLERHHLPIATIISPHAIVSDTATVQTGTIVMHHAIVNAATNIGKNCIINSKALVEHNCQIGDHCHISTGAIINGHVKVDDNGFIGSHSTINLGVAISKDISIASHSLVTQSLNKSGIYKGVPVSEHKR